jgi:hypothetical protein
VTDIPLARLDPSALEISSFDGRVRGWGVAGKDGGLLWVQDFSLEGRTIAEIRNDKTICTGVQLEIQGLTAGTYSLRPYDTWQGKYLAALQITCKTGEVCKIALPNFHADMAFKLERK